LGLWKKRCSVRRGASKSRATERACFSSRGEKGSDPVVAGPGNGNPQSIVVKKKDVQGAIRIRAKQADRIYESGRITSGSTLRGKPESVCSGAACLQPALARIVGMRSQAGLVGPLPEKISIWICLNSLSSSEASRVRFQASQNGWRPAGWCGGLSAWPAAPGRGRGCRAGRPGAREGIASLKFRSGL